MPLHFALTLDIHEQPYSIRERELLEVVQPIRHWRYYLYGRPCEVHTEHESLRHLSSQEELNDRRVKWLELLDQFQFKTVRMKDTSNAVAEALSRTPSDHRKSDGFSHSLSIDRRDLVGLCPARSCFSSLPSDVNARRLDAIERCFLGGPGSL